MSKSNVWSIYRIRFKFAVPIFLILKHVLSLFDIFGGNFYTPWLGSAVNSSELGTFGTLAAGGAHTQSDGFG